MAAKFGCVLRTTCTSCRKILPASATIPGLNISVSRRHNSSYYGSLVSTSLPDVDSEIENVSRQSARGKAMRQLQQRLKRGAPMRAPRELKMKEDQDWSAVYPTAASFKWSAVPLPIRMGLPVKRGLPPHKYGNTELLKIPNFLHLTPPAIKKHCAALKELCTEWPSGLETDEKCESHFPVEVESSDYLFSAPSIRRPEARVVTIKIKLSNLQLDKHARWKMLQLIGERYNKETDIITITTDRCPIRKQNYDYAMYLLTVLYHESLVTEPWESSITEDDMEMYEWDINQSKTNLLKTIGRMEHKESTPGEVNATEESEVLERSEVQEFKSAITDLRNSDNETIELLDRYKQAVLNTVHKKVVPLQ